MTRAGTTPAHADPAGLLERAIGYALGTVQDVTPQFLWRPTPCPDWDLRLLLYHVNDSLNALREGADAGYVGLVPAEGDDDEGGTPADLVAAFRHGASRLLGAWTAACRHNTIIPIGDLPLPAGIMAGAGAIEIAAHGWDISQACGQRKPIPPALATGLLSISQVIISGTGRHPQFAAPVTVPALATPSDRLIAFLGRRPHE
jgi:uncharacterized protein (TIGR03086 family)